MANADLLTSRVTALDFAELLSCPKAWLLGLNRLNSRYVVHLVVARLMLQILQ